MTLCYPRRQPQWQLLTHQHHHPGMLKEGRAYPQLPAQSLRETARSLRSAALRYDARWISLRAHLPLRWRSIVPGRRGRAQPAHASAPQHPGIVHPWCARYPLATARAKLHCRSMLRRGQYHNIILGCTVDASACPTSLPVAFPWGREARIVAKTLGIANQRPRSPDTMHDGHQLSPRRKGVMLQTPGW